METFSHLGIAAAPGMPTVLIVVALAILAFAAWIMSRYFAVKAKKDAPDAQASEQATPPDSSPIPNAPAAPAAVPAPTAPAAAPAAPVAPAVAPAPIAPAVSPTVASGISEEIVAVISTAIAYFMEESAPGVSYAIQSIGRPRESRPVWGFAGMLHNTRPF